MFYDMKEKKLYLECPYCKNNTFHRVLASHEYRSHFFYHEEKIEVTACDHFVACEGCNNTTLYYTNDFISNDLYSFDGAIVSYPNRHKVSDIIPDEIKEIKKAYSEAEKILELSPSAYVTQIRKLLEFVCKKEGAKSANLKEQIRELSRKNILPGMIPDIADKIRFIGNIGAHEVETEVLVGDARIIRDLFYAIIEYLYILPRKIKAIEEAINRRNKGKKSKF